MAWHHPNSVTECGATHSRKGKGKLSADDGLQADRVIKFDDGIFFLQITYYVLCCTVVVTYT
jgi:hypothetical protein